MPVAVLSVLLAIFSLLPQGFAQGSYAGYAGYSYPSEGGYGSPEPGYGYGSYGNYPSYGYGGYYPQEAPFYPGIQPVLYYFAGPPSYPAGYPAAYPSYPVAYPAYPAAYPSYPAAYPSYPAAYPSYPAAYPSYPAAPGYGSYTPSPGYSYTYYSYPAPGGYATYGYPSYSYSAPAPAQQCCACPAPGLPATALSVAENTTTALPPSTDSSIAKMASTTPITAPKFSVYTSIATELEAGECFCSYDPDWHSWALAEQPCRDALYRRCDKHSRLPCSWLDSYYGSSSKALSKPHEDDIARFLYNECPAAPPCHCSNELPTSTGTTTPSPLCCQQLSLHASVPFSGLQQGMVDQVCMKYNPKLTPVIRQWVEKALWSTECPSGSNAEDAPLKFMKRVNDPLAPSTVAQEDEIESIEAEAEARALAAERARSKEQKTIVGALTGALIGMAAGLVVGGVALVYMVRQRRTQQYGLVL